MSEYIHKSHNVTVLLYRLVFPGKYRRAVFDEKVDGELKEICLGEICLKGIYLDMEIRYQLQFLEVGTDQDHDHILV